MVVLVTACMKQQGHFTSLQLKSMNQWTKQSVQTSALHDSSRGWQEGNSRLCFFRQSGGAQSAPTVTFGDIATSLQSNAPASPVA